jgi:OmpA-OmpF porin, OOP family
MTLVAPLKAERSYYIEFYYKLASNSKFSIDRIGFFLNDSASRRTDDLVVYSKPTYQLILPSPYTRTTGVWAKCSHTLRAKGGERYLTIGNFSDNENTRTHLIKFSKAKVSLLNTAAYYLIDDVRVVPLDEPPPEKMPVIAGYKKIEVNKTYVLKNVFFEFDSYELMSSSFAELDKWLEVIRIRPQWKIQLTGHTDERGTDDYNLTLSKQRVENVAAYLAKMGVEPGRITTVGEGKSKPLSDGKDEAAHALNRRVEIKFTEKKP